MTRRTSILVWAAALSLRAAPASAAPRLGGQEWSHRFERFMKELNLFVIDLNDNHLDITRWARVRQAWSELDAAR